MSYLIRMRCERAQDNYFNDLYRTYGGIPVNHYKAIRLRMQYFRRFVLDRAPNSYKTNVEKDWAYVARREYRYDVNVRAIADGLFWANIACVARMFMLKKFVVWPFLPVFVLVYYYRQYELFVKFNKKFFDMCNLGEQYELGYSRNVVLRECNQLLERNDF